MTIPWNKGKSVNAGKDNPFYGRKHSQETLQKISEKLKGRIGRKLSEQDKITLSELKKGIPNPKNRAENNGMWKGDNVGYGSLHTWVKTHLPKSKLCQECNSNPSYDLANITGIYTRDFSNWKYLCRRCHMNTDGRLEILYKRERDPTGRYARCWILGAEGESEDEEKGKGE